jgi:hypothetical protein
MYHQQTWNSEFRQERRLFQCGNKVREPDVIEFLAMVAGIVARIRYFW